MKKETKQIMIILIGVGVIAVALPVNLKKMKSAAPKPAVVVQQTASPLDTMTAQEKRAGVIEYVAKEKGQFPLPSAPIMNLQAEREKLPWRNDPFRKPVRGGLSGVESDFQARNFVVSGIVMKEGVGMAVINGEIYQVGDFADNYKILSITEDSVVMDKDGKEFKIGVQGE